MELFTFAHDVEDRGADMPCDLFRWAFVIEKGSIGFTHQHRFKDTKQWRSSHTTCYMVWWTGEWNKFGSDHMYYDGPHCMFSLGPLTFQYVPRDGWCEQCYDER